MKRNRLRKNVGQHKEEWLQACNDVQDAIREARDESWRDLLASATSEDDEGKLWRFIKSLKGGPKNNLPNEAMKHNGKDRSNR